MLPRPVWPAPPARKRPPRKQQPSTKAFRQRKRAKCVRLRPKPVKLRRVLPAHSRRAIFLAWGSTSSAHSLLVFWRRHTSCPYCGERQIQPSSQFLASRLRYRQSSSWRPWLSFWSYWRGWILSHVICPLWAADPSQGQHSHKGRAARKVRASKRHRLPSNRALRARMISSTRRIAPTSAARRNAKKPGEGYKSSPSYVGEGDDFRKTPAKRHVALDSV